MVWLLSKPVFAELGKILQECTPVHCSTIVENKETTKTRRKQRDTTVNSFLLQIGFVPLLICILATKCPILFWLH